MSGRAWRVALAFLSPAVLAWGCQGDGAAPPRVVVRNPEYLVVRSIRREGDAEHTERVALPHTGAGYGFASTAVLLDLRSFDLGAVNFAGGRTSMAGEATLWLPLTAEGNRVLADWSARHAGDFLGIFLEGRLVGAPQIEGRPGGGLPLRVASKRDGDAVLEALRRGGAPR
jgi:hypothetical protein